MGTSVWSSSPQLVSWHSLAIHQINWSYEDLSFLWSLLNSSLCRFSSKIPECCWQLKTCQPRSAKRTSSWQNKLLHLQSEQSISMWFPLTCSRHNFWIRTFTMFLALKQQSWDRQQSHQALHIWARRLALKSGCVQTIAGFHRQLKGKEKKKGRSSPISAEDINYCQVSAGIMTRTDALSQPSPPSSANIHSLPK